VASGATLPIHLNEAKPFELVLAAIAFVALAGIGFYVQWKTTAEGDDKLDKLGTEKAPANGGVKLRGRST
jgi:hypothetical protein